MPRPIDKLLSGRLWLTFISGAVFGYCSVKRILTPECIATIITAVFMSYFSRNDRKNGNEPPK